MNTRTNRTTDAAEQGQKKTYSYSSMFFNLNATSDDTAEQISQAMIAQLSQHERTLHADTTSAEKKIAIAKDLIKLTTALPLSPALNILIEAARHDLFNNSPAHQIIVNAITKERIHTSPLIVGKQTLSYVLQYQTTHGHEVEKLLNDPGLLLMWINLAPALEVSRLFQHFYQRDSMYHVRMRHLAVAEVEADNPGKALLCSALMSLGRPTEHGITSIKRALFKLKETEHIGQYSRVLKSLHARINPSIYNICGVTDCYINANSLELCTAEFSVDQLQGASFRKAKLDHAIFTKVNLTEAVFNDASLNYADFSHANLQNAKFNHANLAFCSLRYADLRDVNFTGTNLTQADLSGTRLDGIILEDAVFNDAKFLNSDDFRKQSLQDALTRLQLVIQGHPQNAKLRTAICHDIIRYTQSKNIACETAMSILKAAEAHPIFGHHKGMDYIKAGLNLAVSTYFSFRQTFFPAESQPVEIATRHETSEQQLLREELEKRTANTVKSAFVQPPMPDHPPPPAPH